MRSITTVLDMLRTRSSAVDPAYELVSPIFIWLRTISFSLSIHNTPFIYLFLPIYLHIYTVRVVPRPLELFFHSPCPVMLLTWHRLELRTYDFFRPRPQKQTVSTSGTSKQSQRLVCIYIFNMSRMKNSNERARLVLRSCIPQSLPQPWFRGLVIHCGSSSPY